MERRIDPDAPLDYVELQIFPSHNRYEACVSNSNKAEKVASGDLQQLLLHLPQVKDLSSKTSDSNFRILPPDDVKDADWFTNTTLTRFLNVVGSPDIVSIGNEISQLEETRNFQLSLFAKAEVDMTSSFESKNELLRAVDSRLSGLKEQLTDALNQATGARCSPKDISDLENFAHHFGAEVIRDTLQKFLESGQSPLSQVSTTEKTVFPSQPSQLNPPVKYGVSPAKAAQIERQSSTDSFSSEDDQPTAERSRTIARSATPRRSASPMRRVQIGRTGQRRSTPLSIKSLGYFPNREKTTTIQKDATCHSSEDDEDSEKPAKNNALRMSVQDKISLFESKKKEQNAETEKSKGVPLTAPIAKKAVLRRWSSGMSESANETSIRVGPDDGAPGGDTNSETVLENIELSATKKEKEKEKGGADILNVEMEHIEREKHPDSIEWNQQKEAELNQLFKKMMESKPVRRHSVTNDNNNNKNKNTSNPTEQRGGFYDHYKQKRDEKLRTEGSRKKAEKESRFKEMEKFLDEKKAEMTEKPRKLKKEPSRNILELRNSRKNPNSKKEGSEASVVKKTTTTTTTKPSTLPATRKSWPSTPSPRPTGASPSRTPTPSNLTRKPRNTSSPAVRSTTKIEKPQPRSKSLKSTQPDAKTIKTVAEKKEPIITKSVQKVKPKSQKVDSSVATTAAAAKPSFYNKVTKKSSVVPLETKPFLRKGTGIGPPKSVVVKSKAVAQPPDEPIEPEKNQAVEPTETASPKREPPESVEPVGPIKHEEPENSNQFDNYVDEDSPKKMEITDNTPWTENESTISISPTAWVEIEEHNQDEIIQVSGPANVYVPAGVSSPRVRHSLFQMLLEETSEPDSCEWGNAQHPPAVVNQKEAPKGFKRLLKFARKTKADLHLTDSSSPSSIFRRG